jgi:hypothetical protein
MSIVMVGATSGSITLQEPAVAGTTTINLPASSGTAMVSPQALTIPNTTGTVMVSGNMPAFSAYLNGNQSVSGSTFTKVAFDNEVFDTNSNFASNRFTPTVAGYYQINAAISFASAVTYGQIAIYKNGSLYQTVWSQQSSSNYGQVISSLVYCNGTTDYIEIYGYVAAITPRFSGGSDITWVNGSLVRAA